MTRRLILAAVAGVGLLSGCAGAPVKRGIREALELPPDPERLGRACAQAAGDPAVWGPAALALALQAGGMDGRLGDWVADRTPLFLSPASAEAASDRLRAGCELSYYLSILTLPGASDWSERFGCWAGNGAVGLLARNSAGGITALLKSGVGRRRPDGSDRRSFPSGHASESAAYASLAAVNLTGAGLPDRLQRGARFGCAALAIACAYSRVEARRHFPADALAGYALGRFSARFLAGAFLREAGPGGVAITIVPVRAGLSLRATGTF